MALALGAVGASHFLRWLTSHYKTKMDANDIEDTSLDHLVKFRLPALAASAIFAVAAFVLVIRDNESWVAFSITGVALGYWLATIWSVFNAIAAMNQQLKDLQKLRAAEERAKGKLD